MNEYLSIETAKKLANQKQVIKILEKIKKENTKYVTIKNGKTKIYIEMVDLDDIDKMIELLKDKSKLKIWK